MPPLHTRKRVRAAVGFGVAAALMVALVMLPRMSWRTGRVSGTDPLEPSRSDAVDRINRGLAGAGWRPDSDRGRGRLLAVLAALDIPVESQTLVYSKTSRQRAVIAGTTPRAIYFNERSAVGWVPGGDAIEITIAEDARKGVEFYTLEQRMHDEPPAVRAGERCFECHALPDSGGLSGLLMRSTSPAWVLDQPRVLDVDDRTPYNDRWRGWYVTGHRVPPGHAGQAPPPEIDTVIYPSLHSDVVALLVLGHQVQMTNLILRLAQETRFFAGPGETPEPAGLSARAQALVVELVDYMLFAREEPLPGSVRGLSGFADVFQVAGPRDSQGRSLRDLDLDRRLFRYPCSYMIYAPVFEHLPPRAKQAVYARLSAVLSGGEAGPEHARLSAADRQTVRDILRATKSDLPPGFGLR